MQAHLGIPLQHTTTHPTAHRAASHHASTPGYPHDRLCRAQGHPVQAQVGGVQTPIEVRMCPYRQVRNSYQ